MNASFHPAARKELLEAARFPASGAPVLGLDEVYDVRQLTLRSFPFIIITAILREELIVVALAHTKRPPEYWKLRLK